MCLNSFCLVFALWFLPKDFQEMESPGIAPYTNFAHSGESNKAIEIGGQKSTEASQGKTEHFVVGGGEQRLELRSWQALPVRILKLSKGSLSSHFPCPPFEWRAYLYLFWLKAVLTDIKQVKTKHSFSKSCLFSWSYKKSSGLFIWIPVKRCVVPTLLCQAVRAPFPWDRGNTGNTPVCPEMS